MHEAAYQFVESAVAGKSFGRVVEFGSLDINGSVKPLFNCDDYHGIDLQSGPGVDEIADAIGWNSDKPVDCIVCCEVLEHCPDLYGLMRTAARNLRSGGVLIVTCATGERLPHSAYDGGELRKGEYYENVSPLDLLLSCHRYGLSVRRLDVNSVDLRLVAEFP